MNRQVGNTSCTASFWWLFVIMAERLSLLCAVQSRTCWAIYAIYLAPCRYVDLTNKCKVRWKMWLCANWGGCKMVWRYWTEKKRRKNECAWTFLGRFTSGAHLYCTRELTLPHPLFAVAVYTYIIIPTLIHSLQQILQLQLLQLTLRWNITWC